MTDSRFYRQRRQLALKCEQSRVSAYVHTHVLGLARVSQGQQISVTFSCIDFRPIERPGYPTAMRSLGLATSPGRAGQPGWSTHGSQLATGRQNGVVKACTFLQDRHDCCGRRRRAGRSRRLVCTCVVSLIIDQEDNLDVESRSTNLSLTWRAPFHLPFLLALNYFSVFFSVFF